MKFHKTYISDLVVVDLDKIEDERGFFARAFCKDEFENEGLEPSVIQANLSFNKDAATLRGMHYQTNPYEESKFIRCLSGSIYDVVIDLRKDSLTYMSWFGIELNQYNRKALYVPKNFAHGYITLETNSEVLYLVSQAYTQGAEKGIRWDDAAFNIDWPIKPINISKKDSSWNNFF